MQIRQETTEQGTIYVFSHYQDAYKKAQRIQASTGYKQAVAKVSDGYSVLEPRGANQPKAAPMQPTSMAGGPAPMGMPGMPGGSMPSNIGFEFPPSAPPGLFDGKW